jgi:hypothetical protein
MAWKLEAGVAPSEAGAIIVWCLGLSKPRADGVFYVVLSEVCHEPSMAQKGNRRGLRNFRLSSPFLSPPAQQYKKRELTTQGFIYHFTNNKMKPVRKESAQPYFTRVSISG